MLLIILIILIISLVGVRKTLTKIKSTSKEVADVVKSGGMFKKDPIERLRDQIKAYKLKLSELEVNTTTLKDAYSKQQQIQSRAIKVAEVAKEKGNRQDSLEAFQMSKAAYDSMDSLRADIKANDELYQTMKNSLSGRQMQLNKFEASAKRRELRSAANTIRRDIAKDELLEEGLFASDLTDETCQEEIEALAIEKVNTDLKGGDVLEKYSDQSDEEFEKFFGEKSE